MKINQVRAFTVESKAQSADYHLQAKGHWIVDTIIANPMSVYPEYKKSRTSWGIGAMRTVVVEIETDKGIVGIGASIGGPAACYIIEHHLKRFLLGKDPRDIEIIWDQMWRASLYYGRKGLAIMAISAIDLALWDVLGKMRKEPVFNLIGGKTKDRIPMYATMPRPDFAKKMGFWGAKLPLPYGPADGEAGMKKNIEIVAKARKQVGPDYELMLDCYMALNVPYTIELARRVEPYRVKWIEEFLHPDDYEGHSQVRAAVKSCLLTTGEHEYTRYGFRELITRRCVDIVQPDVTWCGGLTEVRKIAAMAAAYDILVVPHGSSIFSYHFVLASTSSPFAEFLVMSKGADRIVPMFGELFVDEPVPVNGYLELTDKPGWGVELNRKSTKLERPFPR